ncbi:hypothetical protein BDW59DRAFT_167159 [Aspergillus cavernicola]|uniref:F-box domain-containing protein n=1 Tax=Aspergillus cavernicola TaxID=176166 RepID=A0ABR4HIF7_9EURO
MEIGVDPYYDCFPTCHICSSAVILTGANPRLVPGVYTGEGMMTDRRFWRDDVWERYYLLSHPQKQICQISGIGYILEENIRSRSLQVPWNEDTGVIEPDKVNQSLLTNVFCQRNRDHDPPDNRLTGFTIHCGCWDLLRTHKVWSLAGGDVSVVLGVLRQKIAIETNNPKLDIWNINWPMISDKSGPFFNPDVQRFIRQARRMTQKRFKVIRHKDQGKTLLCCLPPEVLMMVANFLPAPGVAAVQKAMGTYLGDRYWRSRIPIDLFHEVKALKSQTLDWEFLASELERFDGNHPVELMKHVKFMYSKRKRFNGDLYEELLSRRWLLRRLDQIADLIPSGILD